MSEEKAAPVSKPDEDSPRRALLKFADGTQAVLLFDDAGAVVNDFVHEAFSGCEFVPSPRPAPLKSVLETPLGVRITGFENLDEATTPEEVGILAWTLCITPSGDAVIPMHSVPKRLVTSVQFDVKIIGSVITGKQHLAGNRIVDATMLAHDAATPFEVDNWGDSWNDSFYLEPRINNKIPSTVFNAVSQILDSAKRAFAAQDYQAAATKYRKAFHYMHKFYPENLEAEDLATAAQLKLRAVLNLSLAGVKEGSREWLRRAIESADFVLDMPEATANDRAKALYRRGRARLALGDDVLAADDFERSMKESPDDATVQALADCRAAAAVRQNELRQKMRNAFT